MSSNQKVKSRGIEITALLPVIIRTERNWKAFRFDWHPKLPGAPYSF